VEFLIIMAKIQLFVPTIGAILRLTKPWTFSLYNERRNDKLLKAVGYEEVEHPWRRNIRPVVEVTLPKGVELKVERIYVRQGLRGFDSITFRLLKPSLPKDIKALASRFWVKLGDANQIVCEIVEDEASIKSQSAALI